MERPDTQTSTHDSKDTSSQKQAGGAEVDVSSFQYTFDYFSVHVQKNQGLYYLSDGLNTVQSAVLKYLQANTPLHLASATGDNWNKKSTQVTSPFDGNNSCLLSSIERNTWFYFFLNGCDFVDENLGFIMNRGLQSSSFLEIIDLQLSLNSEIFYSRTKKL